MSICHKCNGKGKIYVDGLRKFVNCPICNGIKVEAQKMVSEDNQITMESLMIPQEYDFTVYGYTRDVESENRALKTYSKESVERVLEALDNMYLSITEGKVVKSTEFVWLGHAYDEMKFVYGSQLELVRRGKTTAPFISGLSLLMLANGNKASFGKSVGETFGVTFADYLESDYVFLYLGAKGDKEVAKLIVDLVVERRRRGLATMIFTYWAPHGTLRNIVDTSHLDSDVGILEFKKDDEEEKGKAKEIDKAVEAFLGDENVSIDML